MKQQKAIWRTLYFFKFLVLKTSERKEDQQVQAIAGISG